MIVLWSPLLSYGRRKTSDSDRLCTWMPVRVVDAETGIELLNVAKDSYSLHTVGRTYVIRPLRLPRGQRP